MTTLDWFPQGITGFESGKDSFIAASWYSKLAGEANKGVRVSIVDITEMEKSLAYRHVLLLDEDDEPLRGNHAGGLVYLNKESNIVSLNDSTFLSQVESFSSFK